MKKVLHRSFKPAKCKISLQMANSRLKILKNKKETQIKQLRKELAQLLESGQTQNAKIRVEHVVREEKTVAAYELVGIYCELIVARLGVIDSQKTCPNDLKEAVTSVLYASQRLTDVGELSDVVKQFNSKYGKDFVNAAIGLQPDSGVSRLLVEKLSVKAPDGVTKIKVLKEIAKEHNVTWEDESDTKETVSLVSNTTNNQPLTDGEASSSSTTLSDVNIGKTADHHYHQDLRPSGGRGEHRHLNPQSYGDSYATDGPSSSHTTTTSTDHQYREDLRPSSGDRGDGRGENRHPPNHSSYGVDSSSEWEKMEFVDATTAARVAAESAERASFAARAAAELSSKERLMASMQNSPSHARTSSSIKQSRGFAKEDHQSTARAESTKKAVNDGLSGHASRKTMPSSTEPWKSTSYDTSRYEPLPRDSTSSSHKQSGGFAKEDQSRAEASKKSFNELSGNASQKTMPSSAESQSTSKAESSKKSVDEVLPENASWRTSHSRNNSVDIKTNESFTQVVREEKKRQPSIDDINLSSTEDVLLRKLSSRASSGSESNYLSDDNNVGPSILEDNLFHSSVRDTENHTLSPDDDDVDVVTPAFDDYGYLFDKPQFDTEDVYLDEQGFSLLGSTSSTSKIPDHMPTETDSWSNEGHKPLRQPSLEVLKKDPIFDDGPTSPPPLGQEVLEKEEEQSFPIFDDGPTSPPPPASSLHEAEPPTAMFDDYDRDYESEEKPKLISVKSTVSEAPDDLGRYFFPSDNEEDQVDDDSEPQVESDTETLASGLKNEETLPSYAISPPRDESLTKPVEELVGTEVEPTRSSSIMKDVYSQEASKPDIRPVSIPLESSSSSEDETEMELMKRVSSRNQDKRRTQPIHEESEEERPTRASFKSQEKMTHKTTPASYFHTLSSDDEKEVRRDGRHVEVAKPSVFISRRTKVQERRSSLVSKETDKPESKEQGFVSSSIYPVGTSFDQESPPKLRPSAKPLAKQEESVPSSSHLAKTTDRTSYDQESPPKLRPRDKPLAKQEDSASYTSSLPKTKRPSNDQVSPPKLGSWTKPPAKQEVPASSSSSLQTSHDQESPPKLSSRTKPLAKQEVSASSSNALRTSYDQESTQKLPSKPKPLAKQEVPASSLNSLRTSHDQESPPKVLSRTKPLAKQDVAAVSSSSLLSSHDQESPPKLGSRTKPLAKQEGSASASSSSTVPKTETSPDPVTPAKDKPSHVHPKLPDYDDIFAKLGALRR